MYAHLLVPTDGSKLSDKAVTHAIALAQGLNAKISFFYASPDYPLPAYADGVVYEPISKRNTRSWRARKPEQVLDRATTKASAAGVECSACT
jgi:nucleotide-binding universal stress UspA family protein